MLFNDNFFDVIDFFDVKDKNEREIFNCVTGLEKGNMFPNEYKEYKNYKPKSLQANNEKEDLLFKIIALSFAINDLNLYLDLHKNDKHMLNNFYQLIKEKKILEEKYTKQYGPICIEQVTGNDFNWVSSFPWDNLGGDIYV